MLISRGRLDPGASALEFMNLVLPITAEIADLSTKLPEKASSDPADRLIAATAIHHRATLISTDVKLAKAGLPVAVVG